MRSIILRILTSVVTVAVLCYAGDDVVFRYRVWRNLSPYGSTTVDSYYAIPEKNQKTEYVYDSTRVERCVNSWFPHSGLAPCWYARRHTEEIKD